MASQHICLPLLPRAAPYTIVQLSLHTETVTAWLPVYY